METLVWIFYTGVFLLALLIVVLWVALPFAVFGIKDKLDKIIRLLSK